MKKSRYTIFVETTTGAVYYNSFSNSYILLNERLHDYFNSNNDIELIKNNEPDLFFLLQKNNFIVDDDCDEKRLADYERVSCKLDSRLYHIVINTTLDCNLDCWYCYENKGKQTNLTDQTLNNITNNIRQHYNQHRYKDLKLSFFGGEPLFNFRAVKNIVDFSRDFCKTNEVTLHLDFTTNGTLLSDSIIEYIGSDKAYFQITLDGYKQKHDSVRFQKINKKGTYDTILLNINKIITQIPNAYVWIRINFDKETLININDLVEDIKLLDKNKCSIILRKIWQVDINSINKDIIINAINKLMDVGFFVDYFALPRVKPCFAERLHQVLVNYDSKIFKCSTIDDFCEKHTVGKFRSDASIEFDQNHIAKKMISDKQPICENCVIYPACYGPCSQNVNMSSPFCILDNLGLTMEELISYNFKLNVLKRRNND